jgi:hypothetical protein
MATPELDPYVLQQIAFSRAMGAPPMAASHVNEGEFRKWYADKAKQHDLNPDPEGQFYDYRAAFQANASPDETGHWPSDFKREGHPNMVVGGFNVKTGARVSGTPQATAEELMRLGWDENFARRNGRR